MNCQTNYITSMGMCLSTYLYALNNKIIKSRRLCIEMYHARCQVYFIILFTELLRSVYNRYIGQIVSPESLTHSQSFLYNVSISDFNLFLLSSILYSVLEYFPNFPFTMFKYLAFPQNLFFICLPKRVTW